MDFQEEKERKIIISQMTEENTVNKLRGYSGWTTVAKVGKLLGTNSLCVVRTGQV